MKKMLSLVVAVMSMLTITAQRPGGGQDVPYGVDETFTPTLLFMQKVWIGDYIGMDPGSRLRLNIRRVLKLGEDMTFINETKGYAEGMDTIVFKHEEGIYSYVDGIVHYIVVKSLTLDLRTYIVGDNLVYVEDAENYTEAALFTEESSSGSRQWVAFDTRLKSPQDPNRDVVYVMDGTEVNSEVLSPKSETFYRNTDTHYSLSGYRLRENVSGVHVVNRKKVIVR